MSGYIRFVVSHLVGNKPRRVGLFQAAYHLRDEVELYPWDRERLEELLAWFSDELPTPPKGAIPGEAVFWFVDAGPFYDQMQDLSRLISEYGYRVELLTASFIGRVVYRDEYQMAALPRVDRFRARPN